MHNGLTHRLQICLTSTEDNRIVSIADGRKSLSKKETTRILPA